MSKIIQSAKVVANSCGGNPILAMLVVFGFYLFFNMILAHIETLIWGERFPHWVDVPVALMFMAYMALSVWCCAVYRIKDNA